MIEDQELSLETINGGAVAELFDNALKKVIENIHDINTTIDAREIVIKAVFKPLNEERRDIIVYKVIPKIKLAGQEPITGSANVKVQGGKLVATVQPVQKEPQLIASNVAPMKK